MHEPLHPCFWDVGDTSPFEKNEIPCCEWTTTAEVSLTQKTEGDNTNIKEERTWHIIHCCGANFPQNIAAKNNTRVLRKVRGDIAGCSWLKAVYEVLDEMARTSSDEHLIEDGGSASEIAFPVEFLDTLASQQGCLQDGRWILTRWEVRENLSRREKEGGKEMGGRKGGDGGRAGMPCTLKCDSNIFYKLSPVMTSTLSSVISTLG